MIFYDFGPLSIWWHRYRRRLRKRRAWPLLRRVASAYRRTLASRTRAVAVIGSLGKTTTTAAVRAGLGLPTSGTGRNAFGYVALAMLRARPWQRHAVLEIGIDRPGQMIHYAEMVRPDIVVLTAIASDHNQSFESLDHTRDEKARILCGLRKGGLVVANGDDQRARVIAASSDARSLTFGFSVDNDVRADEPILDWPQCTHLKVKVGGETLQLRVPLLGRVMMYPVLAAITVAWAEGRPLDEVVRALEALAPQTGRLEPIQLPDGVWLIRDDFKSSIETIDAALDLLAEVPARRIVVLGEISQPPGSSGPLYRRLGERLGTIVSRAVIVASRSTFRSYATGAARAGLPRTALVFARSVGGAVEAVQADLRPGDVVLIKGRRSQRLARVALALQGRRVGCAIDHCELKGMPCERCPMLERGWAAQVRSLSLSSADGRGASHHQRTP